ncbi:PhoD-like phosphatase-domain-containing protein [Chytriomyces sp. MP71]|nr:PhoD-like phosphatase-domain-containing protein [Chytriomyces sp. MP71]
MHGLTFQHKHPKRTLFIAAVFLVTSAQLLPVAYKTRRWSLDSLRIATSAAPESHSLGSLYLETLPVHENLVYQHAAEHEFYRQWSRDSVAFNVTGTYSMMEQEASQIQFNHGVASGDPLHDSVILWTKLTPPPNTATSFYVKYSISLSGKNLDTSLPGSPATAIGTSIFSGAVLTGPEVDFTVKIDVKGLSPKTVYYFQFSTPQDPVAHASGRDYAMIYSPAGRTQTLPSPDDASISSVEFAVVSCSNLPRGFFNAYSGIAGKPDVDVVLHLGDYIYEYRNGQYGDGSSIGRTPRPDKELLELDDYRDRHSQYKEDEDLQLLHRLKPWIVIWDDHEFVDDISGYATNSLPNETYSRIPVAMRAYFEYLPIRVERTYTFKPAHLSLQKERNLLADTEVYQTRTRAIYRNFQFGTLVDLLMLDTRIHGRDINEWATVNDEEKTMLGYDQEEWLVGSLRDSKARGAAWRVIGNQVVFAPMDHWGFMFNTDAWDGYPASRRRIMDAIESDSIKDVVVLTGDVHTSFAFDVPKSLENYNPSTGAGSLFVEFVTPPVSSPSPLESIHLGFLNTAAETIFPMMEPHMKFMDLSRRGYMILKVGLERTVCEYWYVRGVLQKSTKSRLGAVVETERGSGRITRKQIFMP